MIRAAGILFRNNGKALFLQRAGDGDYPGHWNFPGGKIEDGESVEDAAVRETKEEAGACPDGKRKMLARTVSGQGATPVGLPGEAPDTMVVPQEQVDFTTFLQDVDEPFDVVTDAESSGYAWASIDEPPQPLHPGCAVALRRLQSDELGVARMMAAGELTSPQFYANVALFDIRITGTGTSYRKAHDEWCYRPPEQYLNPEFLARCNGLPVLWEHPEKATLDSKEWQDRVVGTTFLPYIKGDEVWGIVKIYDDGAIACMAEGGLSTSPTVDLDPTIVFKTESDSFKVSMDDGKALLIEGKPSLLDHIAICDKGVWDKGREPAGVNSSRADSDDMSDEDKKDDAAAKAKADEARKDEDAGGANGKLDKLMAMMDSISARQDSFEEFIKDKKKADAAKSDEDEDKKDDKAKADKAKADEDEEAKKANEAADKPGAGDDGEVQAKGNRSDKKSDEDEKKEREDRARKDAEEERKRMDARADAEKLHSKIEALEALLYSRDRMSGEDQAALAGAQAKADAIYNAHGKRAPAPMLGESLLAYRRRLAQPLKEHSPIYKGIDLTRAFADESGFSAAEQLIYQDALTAARNPKGMPDGTLREIERHDGGHRIIEFHGEPRSWINEYAPNRQVLSRVNNNVGR